MKKLVSLLLMLVFVFSLSCAMAEGKKHVENLIVGTTAANNTFNMTTQSDAFGRMNYNGLTQGNYVYRDANGDLQPYFFTSYEISEDGKVLDFTWHKGAIWHDGQPVTDEDIIFTFEFQRDVKKVGGLSNLVSVEITGENAARLVRPSRALTIPSRCWSTTRRPRNPCWMRRAMSMRTATAGANCRTAARWICPSFRSIPAAWKSAPVWAKSSASPSRMSA